MTLAYDVRISPTRAHTFEVVLHIEKPQAGQVLSLPAWIPGSYLIREFARHLGPISARQGRRGCLVAQQDKASWQIDCKAGVALQVQYTVYAHDASVRTAWLEASRGFFNPTSMCLQVLGHTEQSHQVRLHAPAHSKDWCVATGARALKVNKAGWGVYAFDSYDELADSPFEMGPFWRGAFEVSGVPHQFAVTHTPPTFDGERLLRDTQAIVSTHIRFWHGRKKPPHDRYAFLLATTDDGYGGLEHRHSTALICKRADLPRLGDASASEGYQDLLGLISHEYFHTWNVKRMRPIDLARYDYRQENYTEMLWFFEGFTSYYDDVLLVRAGVLSPEAYLKRLTKTVQQVAATPGRQLQSVAQASFEAWTRYYRPDENTLNSTVSYYTKGSLVALCLDLTLRQEGQGDLDQVMRLLWATSKGGPMTEADIAQALQQVGGRSYDAELAQWVHGTEELPVRSLLAQQGVKLRREPASIEQRLGLKATEDRGLHIKQVLMGGLAEKAGFAPGDEWLGLEVGKGRQASAWRLHKWADLSLAALPESQVTAVVARDKRLLKLSLRLPPALTAAHPADKDQLSVGEPLLLRAWLSPAGT